MQHWVMFLPAFHPVGKHRAVGKRLAHLVRGAVVSSVSSSPVETQDTSFGVLDDRRLVLDAEVLEGGTHFESGPVELRVIAHSKFMLEVASWARRLHWLRGRRVGLLAFLLLGTVALISFLGTSADSGFVTRLATVGALALLARLLFGGRFLGRTHHLLGLLSLPLDLHQLRYDLELVIFLLQSSQSKFDVSILR